MTKLPFSDCLPPLMTRMVEDQFIYNRQEDEELTRWPIFKSAEVQAPVLGERVRPMEAPRPTVHLPRFTRLLGRLSRS